MDLPTYLIRQQVFILDSALENMRKRAKELAIDPQPFLSHILTSAYPHSQPTLFQSPSVATQSSLPNQDNHISAPQLSLGSQGTFTSASLSSEDHQDSPPPSDITPSDSNSTSGANSSNIPDEPLWSGLSAPDPSVSMPSFLQSHIGNSIPQNKETDTSYNDMNSHEKDQEKLSQVTPQFQPTVDLDADDNIMNRFQRSWRQ